MFRQKQQIHRRHPFNKGTQSERHDGNVASVETIIGRSNIGQQNMNALCNSLITITHTPRDVVLLKSSKVGLFTSLTTMAHTPSESFYVKMHQILKYVHLKHAFFYFCSL